MRGFTISQTPGLPTKAKGSDPGVSSNSVLSVVSMRTGVVTSDADSGQLDWAQYAGLTAPGMVGSRLHAMLNFCDAVSDLLLAVKRS